MNVWVVFPTLAFVSGIVASGYFLVEWYKHKERLRFSLLWAVGLFLMYWFQLPVILTNSGRVITVTDFNFFFAITLPVVWVAIFLVYMGSLSVLGFSLKRGQKICLGVWFLAAALFFVYHFVVLRGVISTYSLPLVGNLVLYMPLHVMIIFIFLRKLMQPISGRTAGLLTGAAGVMGASILGIARNFIITRSVLIYPPEFWYVVLTEQKAFFLLQTASIILLVLGFFFLHRWYCKLHNVKSVR